jgi:hypothetical protein
LEHLSLVVASNEVALADSIFGLPSIDPTNDAFCPRRMIGFFGRMDSSFNIVVNIGLVGSGARIIEVTSIVQDLSIARSLGQLGVEIVSNLLIGSSW